MSDGAGPIPVLFNAGAGTHATSEDTLRRALGADRVRLLPVAPDGIRAAAAGLVARHEPVIGVAGGDGSLHAAAASIAGSHSALLPVPTGTLNNFARRAGIESLADAAAAMRRGETMRLPVGVVGDRIFLNTLTFGEYSRIVRLREHYRAWLGKWPAAAIAFAAACVSLRRFHVTLVIDGAPLVRRTPFIWIGVGWGSFPRVHAALERRRQPDLELAILRSPSRTAALGFVLRLGLVMLRGERPIRDRALEVLNTRDFTIDSSHRLDATADGEVLRLQPPVEVGVRDAALTVVCLRREPAAPRPG